MRVKMRRLDLPHAYGIEIKMSEKGTLSDRDYELLKVAEERAMERDMEMVRQMLGADWDDEQPENRKQCPFENKFNKCDYARGSAGCIYRCDYSGNDDGRCTSQAAHRDWDSVQNLAHSLKDEQQPAQPAEGDEKWE